MPIALTMDEMREVALAIDAYREALERLHGNHAVGDSISALKSARIKITRECEGATSPGTPRAASAAD